MTIHSDSVYKDTQREIEAVKVDTEELLSLVVPDDEKIYFGDDKDVSLVWDEADSVFRLIYEPNSRTVLEPQAGGDLFFRASGAGGADMILVRNQMVGDAGLRMDSTLTMTDDQVLDIGGGGDARLFYSSADDEVIIKDAVNDFELQRLIKNGGPKHVPRDSAPPSPQTGTVALASPAWDPDGDGNGEIVVYDGTAGQEAADLPNYT